jgi:hypothetical protein
MDKIGKFNALTNDDIKRRLVKGVTMGDMVRYVVYGDYKYRNEEVEVFLHQRTMKKVKYKKREFDIIHPIDDKVINSVKEKLRGSEFLLDNIINLNERSSTEYSRLKRQFKY